MKKATIYDYQERDISPFKELGITQLDCDQTIKEAYKLKRKDLSPTDKERLNFAFNLIKTKELRKKYNLIKNKPLESLDSIKDIGKTPKVLEITQWVKLIEESI